jgi:hypothetical protein
VCRRQGLENLQIASVQPQCPREGVKRIQSSRFALEYIHQKMKAGQHTLPREDQGDAAQVTADDMVLLPSEHLEQVTLHAALLECSQVRVT